MKEQSIRQQRRHQDTADHRKAVVFLRESKQSPYAKNIVPYFPSIFTLHGFSYHYADGHTHLMLTNCWFNCDADSFYSLRLQLAKMADHDRCSKSSFYDITIFVKILSN